MTPSSSPWLIYALGSAFFAALTAVLGKIGVGEINSNLATLIRTVVILVVIGGLVTLRAEWQPLHKLSPYGVLMLVLSGVATGLSWLCYYRALQLGPASRVAPLDKLSVPLVMVFAWLLLGEKLTGPAVVGGLLITAGAVVMVLA